MSTTIILLGEELKQLIKSWLVRNELSSLFSDFKNRSFLPKLKNSKVLNLFQYLCQQSSRGRLHDLQPAWKIFR